MVGGYVQVNAPDVSYARSGDVAIAYQAIGRGPPDLVFVPFPVNLYSVWGFRSFNAFARRLATGRRLVIVNMRGTGLSDQPRGITIEARMDDIRAVLDHLGGARASLFAVTHACPSCVLFASTYPERVERLVLYRPFARGVQAPDYPWALSRDHFLERLRVTRATWGEREQLEARARRTNPQWADDPAYVEWAVWSSRLAVSPGAMVDLRRVWLETDITGVLPSVRVPTLVLSKRDAREECEYVAARIPDSRHVVLPGIGLAVHETDDAAAEIESFLGGAEPPAIPDTVLATLLYTDLVRSSERAAELGDRGWRDALDAHHRLVRRELARFRGVEIDTAGDGFLASFDGPARAIACARAVIAEMPSLGLAVRAGVHTGECERSDGKLAGIALHVGARVAAAAEAGEVLVSGTVKDLVAGSGVRFEDRGARELKGVGEWRLYAVADG
jgi:class 3 adenylate cyclase